MTKIVEAFVKIGFFRRLVLKLYRRNVERQMRSSFLRGLLKKHYELEVGYHSYGFLQAMQLPRGTKIGRYTSIAEGLKVFRRNHPTDTFSTHPYFYSAKMGYLNKDTINSNEENPLSIGNDVWIGADVTILPGCKYIGNGAVIGANSVITRDVKEFDVVAGNAAKKIGVRGDAAKCEWWNKEPSELVLSEESKGGSFHAEGEV